MSRISQIVADAKDIETEEVPIPQWGVTIEVRGMDGTNRSLYLNRFFKAKEEGNEEDLASIETDMLVFCCYDPEDGSQAFVAEDIPMLLTKSGAVIGRLATTAMRLSGLDKDAEKRWGKVSSEGTPPSTPNSDSSSTSPSN